MKKSYLLILLAAIMLLFTGCDKVADEKQIQADLEAYAADDVLGENESIKRIEIEKRQTEKDRKMDVVWCNLTTEDTACAYEKGAVLTYTLYDEGGWILDYVTMDKPSQWSVSPLVGVTDEMVAASVDGLSVTADGEQWTIAGNNSSITIDEHDTNLEEKSDTVTATFTIKDEVEEAVGTIALNYVFEDSWELDSVSEGAGFTVSTIAGKEFTATDELLLSALEEQTFEYGMSGTVLSTQTVSINRDEVSNFSINGQRISSKGTEQKYVCSCTLSKPHAEFALDIEIPYHYSSADGWVLQAVDITADCTSLDIEGEWTGTYRSGKGSATLTLSNVDDGGKVTGVFKFVPNTVHTLSQPGSYNVTGEINLTTLEIHFTDGDWVEAPNSNFPAWEKSEFTAALNTEDFGLYGVASGARTFVVTQ